jgi:hypothetical protein
VKRTPSSPLASAVGRVSSCISSAWRNGSRVVESRNHQETHLFSSGRSTN